MNALKLNVGAWVTMYNDGQDGLTFLGYDRFKGKWQLVLSETPDGGDTER